LGYRNLLKECRAIHVTAINELESIKAIGINKEVGIIPNGVSSEEFERLPSRMALNKYFPHLAQKKILLFFSRIHPSKGLSILAHAWGNLSSRFPDWHLLIVGPDYNKHWFLIRKILDSYKINGNFTYAGLLGGEARYAAYGAADLFILPTLSENFGIVVAEALMAKVPVITTTEAPWEEIISNRCGWIIRPEIEELTAVLSNAMSIDRHTLEKMGKRGRKFVRDKYDWKIIALRMIDFYKWIIEGGQRPEFVYPLEGKSAIRFPCGIPKQII
jgi:glycosyltransferase involved in cell wall biosynthesis